MHRHCICRRVRAVQPHVRASLNRSSHLPCENHFRRRTFRNLAHIRGVHRVMAVPLVCARACVSGDKEGGVLRRRSWRDVTSVMLPHPPPLPTSGPLPPSRPPSSMPVSPRQCLCVRHHDDTALVMWPWSWWCWVGMKGRKKGEDTRQEVSDLELLHAIQHGGPPNQEASPYRPLIVTI